MVEEGDANAFLKESLAKNFNSVYLLSSSAYDIGITSDWVSLPRGEI